MIQAIMTVVLLFLMFSMGLVTTLQDFRRVMLTPFTMAVGVAAEVFLVPLIALLAVRALDLPPAVAIGIMLLAICPGGPISNFFSHISGGNPALALTLTVITTFLSLVTMPAFFTWTFLGAHAGGVSVPAKYIMKILLVSVIAPTILGMIVRAKKPEFAARVVKYTEKLGALMILSVIILMFINNRAAFRDIGGLMLAVVCLVNVGGMTAGYLWGIMFRRGRVVAKTIVFEIGIQNIPLATIFAYGLFGADKGQLSVISAMIVLYGIVAPLSSLGAVYIFKKFLPSQLAEPEAQRA